MIPENYSLKNIQKHFEIDQRRRHVWLATAQPHLSKCVLYTGFTPEYFCLLKKEKKKPIGVNTLFQ